MKVLLVAMCDSVHTARWITQFNTDDVHFQLFPSTPHRRLHPAIREVLGDRAESVVKIRRSDGLLALPLGVIDLACRTRFRALRLRRLLLAEDFSIIHLLETQHAGYLFQAASKSIDRLPPVALSIWGSDLAWFQKISKHRERIRVLLKRIDFMFTECDRDIGIARALGFQGEVAKRSSTGGGVSAIANLKKSEYLTPPSLRRGIVIKGYTGFVGRAKVAIRAVISNADLLGDFAIHVYSAGPLMLLYAKLVRFRTHLNIQAYKKKSLSHRQMLQLYETARLSLSVSQCDGLPGSTREAVWTGAFPIESVGSCVNEWLINRETCFLVDPDKPNSVASAVREALLNDVLVDSAFLRNRQTAELFSTEEVRQVALVAYGSLLTRRRRSE
jgi:hypothetical protein